MKKFLFLLIIVIIIILGLIIYFSLDSKVTNNLDEYVYDLPFQNGTSYKVAQGYGGRFSHKNKAALDFEMPEGTPVYAARGGVVFSYKDDSDEGGIFTNEKKANYIIIQHDDGSFGCYWHLRKNGVAVKNGNVSKGELIGYSGSTGFVLQPHLHFAVKRKLNYDMDSYTRTKFRTTKGIMILTSGETYEKPLN